jgi:catechol 2,3-dioxygenase-like lactoylglutathione lyase family enzyme
MPVVFTKHTPNLVVSDLARSLAFYRDLLGFSVIVMVPPEEPPFVFALLQRDGLELFLNDVKASQAEAGHEAIQPGKSGVSLYFDVTGIHALHDALRGKAHVAMPLERKFYGVTEFAITDPDGYLITFAERLD